MNAMDLAAEKLSLILTVFFSLLIFLSKALATLFILASLGCLLFAIGALGMFLFGASVTITDIWKLPFASALLLFGAAMFSGTGVFLSGLRAKLSRSSGEPSQ